MSTTVRNGLTYIEEAQAQKEVTINADLDLIDAKLPQVGTVAPEGSVTGAVGDWYRNTSTGYVYYKASGAGNTGWKQLLREGGSPTWVKVTVGYAALAAAALTNDIEVLNLAAAGVIHAVKIKHSASFVGGSISAYTLSVGIVGNLTKYAAAFDVFQAPGNTVQQLTGTLGTENHGAAVSIRLAATSVGANLNAATAGSVDVWLLVSFAS